MDPDIDVNQNEQPQISYSFDFTAIQSPNLLGREGTCNFYVWLKMITEIDKIDT